MTEVEGEQCGGLYLAGVPRAGTHRDGMADSCPRCRRFQGTVAPGRHL